jgi:hypothetical protein
MMMMMMMMMMALQINLLPNKDQTVKTDHFWAFLLEKSSTCLHVRGSVRLHVSKRFSWDQISWRFLLRGFTKNLMTCSEFSSNRSEVADTLHADLAYNLCPFFGFRN